MKILATFLLLGFMWGCVSDPPEGSLAAIKKDAYDEQYKVEFNGCMRSWDKYEQEKLGVGRNKIYGPGGIDQWSACTNQAKYRAGRVYR